MSLLAHCSQVGIQGRSLLIGSIPFPPSSPKVTARRNCSAIIFMVTSLALARSAFLYFPPVRNRNDLNISTKPNHLFPCRSQCESYNIFRSFSHPIQRGRAHQFTCPFQASFHLPHTSHGSDASLTLSRIMLIQPQR